MKAWEVMTWAFTVPVDSAAERAVLTAYAWRAGAKLLAWPGLEQLGKDTGLYRETISTARRDLVSLGYLLDTGQRRGVSGRVAVYRLNVNLRQKPHIDADQSAAKAEHCDGEMSGKSRGDERQKPPTDTPEKPLQNLVIEQSRGTVQGAQARELAPSAEAVQPEQAQRTEGLKSARDKVAKAFPQYFKASP